MNLIVHLNIVDLDVGHLFIPPENLRTHDPRMVEEDIAVYSRVNILV